MLCVRGRCLTVWLPKFELARKMFFHAASSFVQPSHRMAWTWPSRSTEGRCCSYPYAPEDGGPKSASQIKGYRDHFSWLLLNQDVRRPSSQSGKASIKGKSGYCKSRVCQVAVRLSGTHFPRGYHHDVRGPFDPESNELLVWEIEKFRGSGLAIAVIFFSITLLSSTRQGREHRLCIRAIGSERVEVDADEEPTAAKEQRLIHLPLRESRLMLSCAPRSPTTGSVQRSWQEGRRRAMPEQRKPTLGVADPVSEGSIASGEFQQLVRERVMGTSMNGLQIASRCSRDS